MTKKGQACRYNQSFDWIRPGAPCWYNPAQEAKPYSGVVGSELFDCGGERCVKVIDLDERFVKRSGRDRVGRAAWYTIRPRRVKDEHARSQAYGQNNTQ